MVEEFDFVRNTLAPAGAPVVAYGWSVGIGLAIRVTRLRQAAGLILQAPPASSDEMMHWSSQHEVPAYGRWLVNIRADPSVAQTYEGVRNIREVKIPLLVIQGNKDEVVPLEQGREVSEASPAKQKTFVEVPEAHHNDLRFKEAPFKEAPAASAVRKFLESFQ